MGHTASMIINYLPVSETEVTGERVETRTWRLKSEYLNYLPATLQSSATFHAVRLYKCGFPRR